MFKDRVIAITGGTGSFGKYVLKRFLKTDVREIRIFSRDELKQETMRTTLNDSKLKFHIGDVREYDSIHQALKGVDFVFHAAALKQVPSCVDGGVILHHSSGGISSLRRSKTAPPDNVFVSILIWMEQGRGHENCGAISEGQTGLSS